MTTSATLLANFCTDLLQTIHDYFFNDGLDSTKSRTDTLSPNKPSGRTYTTNYTNPGPDDYWEDEPDDIQHVIYDEGQTNHTNNNNNTDDTNNNSSSPHSSFNEGRGPSSGSGGASSGNLLVNSNSSSKDGSSSSSNTNGNNNNNTEINEVVQKRIKAATLRKLIQKLTSDNYSGKRGYSNPSIYPSIYPSILSHEIWKIDQLASRRSEVSKELSHNIPLFYYSTRAIHSIGSQVAIYQSTHIHPYHIYSPFYDSL